MLNMISCISKIKIGKIQFTSPHLINNLQQIKDNINININENDKNNHKNDKK